MCECILYIIIIIIIIIITVIIIIFLLLIVVYNVNTGHTCMCWSCADYALACLLPYRACGLWRWSGAYHVHGGPRLPACRQWTTHINQNGAIFGFRRPFPICIGSQYLRCRGSHPNPVSNPAPVVPRIQHTTLELRLMHFNFYYSRMHVCCRYRIPARLKPSIQGFKLGL